MAARPPSAVPTSTDALALLLERLIEPVVRRVVTEVLIEHVPAERAPELLTTEQLCAALGCSRTSLHRLVLDGLPRLMLLDSPRYRVADCIAWLEQRTRSRARAEAAE